jgi:GH18 family chitinase
MVGTRQNRATFIANLMAFLRQYAFDGVDFDWVRNARSTHLDCYCGCC